MAVVLFTPHFPLFTTKNSNVNSTTVICMDENGEELLKKRISKLEAKQCKMEKIYTKNNEEKTTLEKKHATLEKCLDKAECKLKAFKTAATVETFCSHQLAPPPVHQPLPMYKPIYHQAPPSNSNCILWWAMAHTFTLHRVTTSNLAFVSSCSTRVVEDYVCISSVVLLSLHLTWCVVLCQCNSPCTERLITRELWSASVALPTFLWGRASTPTVWLPGTSKKP